MRLHEHALRRQVVNEMHLRRFARLDPPALAIQTVRLLDDEQWEKEWSVISDLRGAELDRTARHMETGWKDAVRIAWERHSEAITTTLTFATENMRTAVIKGAMLRCCDRGIKLGQSC